MHLESQSLGVMEGSDIRHKNSGLTILGVRTSNLCNEALAIHKNIPKRIILCGDALRKW